MANKKTQLMAEFYRECKKKGYTDMRNSTQSLKAKVIATDLGLKYDDISKFYEKAKKCHEQICAETKEAVRIREEQLKKAEEESRRTAVDGKLLLTLSDKEKAPEKDEGWSVYIRPDKSIYTRINGGSKIERIPAIHVKKAGAILATYHPSQAVYTGATVGGITTGGVHHTQAGHTLSQSNNGKGEITANINGTEITVQSVTISDYTQKKFKRDNTYKSCVKDGQILCFRNTAKADFYLNGYMNAAKYGNYTLMQNTASMLADEKRLPVGQCNQIANLVGQIIHGQFPPSDEELYSTAESYASATNSADLLKAINAFEAIQDFKDAKKRAKTLKPKYEELLQHEKEQAVLKAEASAKKTKKIVCIVAVAVIAVVAVFLLMTKVFIPMGQYNSAVKLMENGQYLEAIAAFEALGDYKDSANKIPECQELLKEAELVAQYADAEELMVNGAYEEAIEAFGKLNSYKDSTERIAECEMLLSAERYTEAEELLAKGQYEEALAIFKALGEYKDSADRIVECEDFLCGEKYAEAETLLVNGQYEEAYCILATLGDYRDTKAYLADFIVVPEQETHTDSNSSYTVRNTYNDQGSLIKEATTYSEGTSITTYTYDSNGLMTKQFLSSYIGSTSSTEFTYNEAGQLIAEYWVVNVGKPTVTTYSYNDDGLLTEKVCTTPYGTISYTRKYSYNSNGHLTTEEYTQANGNHTITIYSYDNRDLLVEESATDSKGTWSIREYSYNDAGLLVKQEWTASSQDSTYHNTTTYHYDDAGLLIKQTFNSDYSPDYTHEYSSYKFFYLGSDAAN